jgi:hypothetical protein
LVFLLQVAGTVVGDGGDGSEKSISSYNIGTCQASLSLPFISQERPRSDYVDSGQKLLVDSSHPASLFQNDHHQSCKAIIDTGTSVIIGPSRSVAIIYSAIFSSTNGEGVKRDCSNIDLLPNIEIIFNSSSSGVHESDDDDQHREGLSFILEPEWYVARIINDDDGEEECFVGIDALGSITDDDNDDLPVWILGVPFLRKYFSVFDRDNDMIGFAIAKHHHDNTILY